MSADYVLVTVDAEVDIATREQLDRGDSVVSFGGTAEGRRVSFAAEHRAARHIVAALEAGEPVMVPLEPYQVMWSADDDGRLVAGWFG